jgi:hypothetical protein
MPVNMRRRFRYGEPAKLTSLPKRVCSSGQGQRPMSRWITGDGQIGRVGRARLRQPLEKAVFLDTVEPVVVPGDVLPVRQDAVVLDEPESAADVQLLQRVEGARNERRLRQREHEIGFPLVRDGDDGVGQH